MNHILATAALLVCTQCGAQVFWSGTVRGESVAQVQAKVPGATTPSESAELRAKGISTLMSVSTTLVNKPFNVYFYFSPNGLDRVIVRRTDLANEAEAGATFSALIEALRHKYGRATGREEASAIASGKAMWLMWSSGDTDLLLVPQHGAEPLTMVYTLSDRSKERAREREAEKYRKSVNPKAEAAKL